MSVAKVVELTASSPTSFEDAVKNGIEKAARDAPQHPGRVGVRGEGRRGGRQDLRFPRDAPHHVPSRVVSTGETSFPRGPPSSSLVVRRRVPREERGLRAARAPARGGLGVSRVLHVDTEQAARRWAETWASAWPRKDAEAIAALYADGASIERSRSASRTPHGLPAEGVRGGERHHVPLRRAGRLRRPGGRGMVGELDRGRRSRSRWRARRCCASTTTARSSTTATTGTRREGRIEPYPGLVT